MRQKESTEKAEKLITPSEGQDHTELHMGTYRNTALLLPVSNKKALKVEQSLKAETM